MVHDVTVADRCANGFFQSLCQSFHAKYAAALGSGTVDPEETLPKFIEELKKAGIEKVISTKQEQLDKWLEENK